MSLGPEATEQELEEYYMADSTKPFDCRKARELAGDWRVAPGHIRNWLEFACDRIEELEKLAEAKN